MKHDYKNKTVIITGGTRGIGEAIAVEFYQKGMSVVVGARHDNGFIKRLGRRARFLSMDVRLEADHRSLVQVALNWTKRVDVYINCAGFSKWCPIEKVDQNFWDEMIDVNLKGTFLGCKVASRFLPKGGCIINVSSIAGKRGSANNTVYCASKFGVTGLTQALAKELGPRGIRVNALCPVYVETRELLKALSDRESPAAGGDVKTYLKGFSLQNAALKRLPSAGEVARTCFFLASPDASAITGQSINVDCGVLLQ